MKVETATLTGPALDWAVAKCEEPIGGYKAWVQADLDKGILHGMNYSSDWLWGGPIIEREEIGISRNLPCSKGREWEARPSISAKGAGGKWGYGPTPLVAAMRCYVASKLGDEVEVPDGLL